MSYSDSETVVGAHSFYTVMVQEEQGWRQLVMPALKPEDACQALADLIRDEKPLDRQSDEDDQHIEQTLRLVDQDGYEAIIGERRHRLVRVNLTVSFGPDGPCRPDPHDHMFMEGPWNLA